MLIDFPDERIEFDHLHAWFGSPSEAHALRRRLEVLGGKHRVVEGGVCPLCGRIS